MIEPKLEIQDQPKDVLEASFFHKLLLLFHRPANWPLWQVIAGLALMAVIVAGLWLILTQDLGAALIAGCGLIFFFATDIVFLALLPRFGRSYGPWQAQAYALAVPRSAIFLMTLPIALIFGSLWGLAISFTIQVLGSLAFIYGSWIEPFRLAVTRLTVTTDRLPAGSLPIRLLHISDLHVERLTRREEKLLQLIDQVEPDLILITGDYLNLSYVRDQRAQDDARQLLAKFSALHGVYAILGSPPVDARDVVPDLFEDLTVRLLVDEWLALDFGDGRQLLLLGMDCSHHLPTDRQRLHHLVQESPNTMPAVLMYHAPDLMPEAVQAEIDLYLCGHTHGGQVRLPGYGAILTSSQLGKTYEMGLYRNGRTHLYVSRGVGLEGLSAPRVRFLAPPEITLVTINSSL